MRSHAPLSMLLASVPGLLAMPSALNKRFIPIDGVTAPVTYTFDKQDAFDKDFTVYGGTWKVTDGAVQGVDDSDSSKWGGKALLNSPGKLVDFVYDIDVTVVSTQSSNGNGGVIFAASNPQVGIDAYEGYYCGFNTGSGQLVCGKADNNYTPIGSTKVDATTGKTYHLRIVTSPDDITVYVDDFNKAALTIKDNVSTKSEAKIGLRLFGATAKYDNLKVTVNEASSYVQSLEKENQKK